MLTHEEVMENIDSIAMPMQRISVPASPNREADVIRLAAQTIKAGKLIVWENGPVMALAGDANNLNLQNQISAAKRDRSPNQPLGWITPFSAASGSIDLENVTDNKVSRFLENADRMTRRLGALCFIRGDASIDYKKRHDIPDSLIPEQSLDFPVPTVQLFSPTANDRCSRLVRYAGAHGSLMAMTSANYHGQKEIVTFDEAQQFARDVGHLLFMPQYEKGEKPLRPRGSYPVISVKPDHLSIIRGGFLDPELIKAVLHDIPTDIAPPHEYQTPKHPENVLRPQDMPNSSQGLRGDELHDAIVDSFAPATPGSLLATIRARPGQL